MPGLVVFRRRWSVGSDDLVVPGAILLIIHLICLMIVVVSLSILDYDTSLLDVKLLFYHQIGYLMILCLSISIEIGICVISMRGSILDSEIRNPINIWIYIKTLILFIDVVWLILGTIWIANFYEESFKDKSKKIFVVLKIDKIKILGIVISNWALVLVTFITVWCTFDAAGRSWVKMKKYQRSMRETESRLNYKRSNSVNRNWRQRKVMRAYQDSWDHRCRLLFCCIGSTERSRNSFTDIARLLSDFFRELDVVPSDVVAGLVLLRKFQRLEREAIVRQRKNGTYEFLSGVPITEHTQFLALNDPKSYDFFQTVIHYMYFAQGAYGWPMYLMINRSRMYHLLPELRSFGCCKSHSDEIEVIQDNCCYCNYAALKKTLQVGDVEILYVTYHVDVGETPFFVAIDYSQKKIVVSIRGTLSMKDILTDLNAESEVLPLDPPREDWLGHKGMVQAAIYIRNKLREENLVEKALNRNPDRNTHTFTLVLVGHSLGAGTASILAVLMKPDYPSLQCFSYSPPGGLLSMPVVEYSKSFITSVVLGKDVVPRIGLYQMEALRADLINAIQRSIDPKWRTISCSIICCGCGPEPTSVIEMSGKDTDINKYQEERDSARSTSAHPTDSSIALTIHQPLYPPGRIIHIVRHHPKPDENMLKNREPVYQAIWADTTDFDEVLISPVMLQDHMPDKVLAALKKVVTTSGPRKPHRQTSNAFISIHDTQKSDCIECEYKDNGVNRNSYLNIINCDADTPSIQPNVCLETSFTNLDSPPASQKYNSHSEMGIEKSSSKTSSLAGSIRSRSQLSSMQWDISSVLDNSIITVAIKSPLPQANDINSKIDCSEKQSISSHRLKAVAFDMNASCPQVSKSPSPRLTIPKSILSRQSSTRSQCKPHLPLPPLRRASDVPNPVDLIHDDWLGLAPLASPETLSEISSISSRNSVRNSLGTSIDRYLQTMPNRIGSKNVLDDIFESQLHTPVVLRRAPKFTENLSTCAEDSRNLDEYKRMSRVIITHPLFTPQTQDSSEEEDSFETAKSYKRTEDEDDNDNQTNGLIVTRHHRQNSKSADQLAEFTNNLPAEKKLTFSDSNILNENDDDDDDEHKQDKCSNYYATKTANPANDNGKYLCSTESEDTTYYSANSSIEHVTNNNNSNANGKCQTANRSGILESHFPIFDDERHLSNSLITRKLFVADKDHVHLNQLVQIPENSCNLPTTSSPGRRRKACIYPSSASPRCVTNKLMPSLGKFPSSTVFKSNESSV
ncbi:inactivation no afterpotential E isoform 2-T2 [Glossina fuscipes fuscipes]